MANTDERIEEINKEIKKLEGPHRQLLELKAERERLSKEKKQKALLMREDEKHETASSIHYVCPYCGRKNAFCASELRGRNNCSGCHKAFLFWCDRGKNGEYIPRSEKIEVIAERRRKEKAAFKEKKYQMSR